MITSNDLYSVLTAVVPLYTTMLLAYASVRWWSLFTPAECAGINRFVAVFAVPLLSFEFISRVDPFRLHLPFLAADAASKLLILTGVLLWAGLARRGSLDWSITAFSLASLPNTLVMGIPLLKAMYGEEEEGLMVQVVVLQCVVWYTLLLFLFEYREARGGVAMEEVLVGSSGAAAQGEEGGVGVDIAVTKPSPEQEQQKGAGQVLNKVVPDSGQPARAEEGGRRELRILVWRCSCCCIPLGHCEQSLQDYISEEEKKELSRKETQGSSGAVAEKKPSGVTSTMSWHRMKTILRMVWWKLVRNPNSYASLLGLTWALASSRTFHGPAGEDSGMWVQASSVRDGAEVSCWSCGDGHSFCWGWAEGEDAQALYCAGCLATRDCAICVCQGVQSAPRCVEHSGHIWDDCVTAYHSDVLHFVELLWSLKDHRVVPTACYLSYNICHHLTMES